MTDFLQYVGTLIPPDKLRIFKSLFRFPVKTNQVTGICFDKLSRVFDGRNPAFNYQFMTTEQRDDWEYYRQDVLKEPTVWQTKGWDNFKTEINSVLIVDMPTEPDPTDKYPQPYFYWLPIADVISYRNNPDTGLMDWIMFKQKDDKIAIFDDKDYQIYEFKKNQIGALLLSTPHNLGYCPARFFWNEPLTLRDRDIKSHPLSKELESLDWFLFFHISKRHLDLYAPYPIYSGYAADCNYRSTVGENEHVCDGGFLTDSKGQYLVGENNGLLSCPKCGDKRIAGVGTYVEIPIPDLNKEKHNAIPDLKNPITLLPADSNSLQYNVDEVERLKRELIDSVVGTDNEALQNSAVNEKQVSANFESQSTILNRIKKGFEAAQQFVDETVCKLRYGNAFVSAKINLGTEFYVEDPIELRNRYSVAKENGASESELDSLRKQIIETEYRHNPTELQRMLILSDLEPYQHLTRAEILDLNSRGLISNLDLYIKMNFVNLVRRFERENINILEFGTQIPYQKKIEIINQKLKDYANQDTGGEAQRREDP